MSFAAIGKKVGVSGLEGPEVDLRAAARDLNKPTKKYEENAVSGFIRGAGQADGPTAEQAFDLFKAIGDLFSGGQQPQRNGKEAANKFDLGAILSSIFDFAGKQAEKSGALPPKEEHHVKGEERVEVSGETGDEHFKAKGRAAAEAHAKANAFSETFIDGSGVGVRGGAEASAGVSAEAEGSITTDIGSLDGKARVSAEVYARLYGEARAGPDGVSAAGKAEVGAMANADAETNLQIADGLIAGHADATRRLARVARRTPKPPSPSTRPKPSSRRRPSRSPVRARATRRRAASRAWATASRPRSGRAQARRPRSTAASRRTASSSCSSRSASRRASAAW